MYIFQRKSNTLLDITKQYKTKISTIQSSITDLSNKKLNKAGDQLLGVLFAKWNSIDSSKISDTINYFNVPITARDIHGHSFCQLRGWQNKSVLYSALTTIAYTEDGAEIIGSAINSGVNLSNNTAFVTSVHPNTNSYNNEVVTTKYSLDHHQQIVNGGTKIYIGGNNASDTANLFTGRGFSASLPFATFTAAINFANKYLRSDGLIYFYLQSDQNITSLTHLVPNCGYFITSIDTTSPCTITLTSGDNKSHYLKTFSNTVFFKYVNFNVDNAYNLLHINGSWCNSTSMVFLTNCNITGTTVTVFDLFHGVLVLENVTGDIVGRKFNDLFDSMIHTKGKGLDSIPGTIAGITNATTRYL